jgi:sigma-B regulation protein RsbU (phosphoserine phosphatase)
MDFKLIGAALYVACGCAAFLFGLVVLREAPGERVRRVTAAMMFFGGFGPLIGGLGMLLERRGDAAILSTDLATTFAYVWELFFPSLLYFALVYPREHPFLTRHHTLPWVLYVPYVFHLAFLLFLGRLDLSLARLGAEPALGLGGTLDSFVNLGGTLLVLTIRLLARFHMRFFSFVDLTMMGCSIYLLARSLRASASPKIRGQLRVVLFGIGGCVGLYALAVPLPNLFASALPHALRMVLVTAALLLGTGAISFAIVRTSFLEVGVVIRRAILFSATFGTIAIGFYYLAGQMDRILQTEVGTEIPFFRGLFVFLAVVFFHPILGWIEGAVDRVVAGERVAHRRVLRDLGRELATIFEISDLSRRTVHSLHDALTVDRVRLFLPSKGGESFEDAASEETLAVDARHPALRAAAALSDPVRARDLADEAEGPGGKEEAREMLRRLEAEIVVPIHLPGGGELAGLLTLGPKATGGRFTGEEMGLLGMLATQVAFALRNARLHEEAVERRIMDEEMARARAVQDSIVPRRSPRIDGLDVAALYVPSRQVGGDYYDLIPLEGGDLGLAVGDVSGKGIPAALLMSMLHAALHVQMNGATRAASLVERLNRILCRSTSVEQFATFFFGVYRRGSGELRFCNGGHNAPVLLRPDGSARSLTEGGTILGFQEDAAFEEGSIAVGEGDLLVLYTDGVTEEAGGKEEEFGETRLLETVVRHRARRAEEIVDAVRAEVSRFAGRERFTDDFTLIVLRGPEAGRA